MSVYNRRTRERAHTLNKVSLVSLRPWVDEEPEVEALRAERPVVRGDCEDGERPCPWVSCKHHLYLDVSPDTGAIKINYPDKEPHEIDNSCALDVAGRGGMTLAEVGEIMNLTRERIRQVEVRGLLRLRMATPSEDQMGANLVKRLPVLVQIRPRPVVILHAPDAFGMPMCGGSHGDRPTTDDEARVSCPECRVIREVASTREIDMDDAPWEDTECLDP